MRPGKILPAKCLVSGIADGRLAVLTAPLSLWGGFDLESGKVSDVNHPQHGEVIAGRILVMPGGRGSSSSSSILLESARLGIQPKAIVITDCDPILVVGALVAAELYGVSIPVVQAGAEVLEILESAHSARLSAEPGKARIVPG